MNTTLLIVILGGIGVLIVLGAAIALVAGGGNRVNVDERLEQFAGSSDWVVDVPEDEISSNQPDFADRLDKAISQGDYNFFDRIKARLARADIKLRVVEYIVVVAASSIVVGLIFFVIFGYSLVLGLIGAIVGLQIPRIGVSVTSSRRMKAFDNQLGDTLNLWVNALRTGFSVMQGMEAIATELPPPISREFERIIQEVRLGIDMEDALANSLRRVPSEDYDLVITAVNIQREVGGNLAEILDVISFTIRERVRIKGEIQTLTAQGRISGWIITALPIALGLIIYFINTEYIQELFAVSEPFLLPDVIPCGWVVVAFSLLMIGAGGYAIQRIVDIEV